MMHTNIRFGYTTQSFKIFEMLKLQKYSWLFILMNLQSQPPCEELYAFLHHFNQNTFHLCPLRGTAARIWLKNLYTCGDGSHATIKLLHLLFNVIENIALRSTSYEPYSNFTYETIVTFIEALENNTIEIKKTNGDFILLEMLRQTFKGNKNPKRLKNLIETIINSKKECKKGIYPAKTTEQILLAFLGQKSSKTRELRKYVSSIKKQLFLPTIQESPRNSKWTEDEFEKYVTWCAEKITIEHEEIPYSFEKDLELLNFCALRENELTSASPPVFYDYIDVQFGKKIADCCESTLKYFCLLICYDNEKKKIDLTRLSEAFQMNMSDCFQNHLTRCNVTSLKEINNKKMREEWFSLISNLHDGQYRRLTKDGKKYEIHPSVNNFINILYHIFGINFHSDTICKATVQNNWNELCDRLSKESRFDISCINTTYHSDVSSTATFLLKENKKDTKEIIFTLHIRPEHSWIAIDTQNDFRLFNIEKGRRIFTQKNLLIKKLVATYHKHPTLQLRDLLHLYAPYIDIAHLAIKNEQDTLLFSHPTENDAQRLRLCKRLLNCIHDEKSLLINNVLRLLETFDQPFFIGEALCGLLRKKVITNEHIINYLFTNTHFLDQWVRVKIFMTLVQLKAWKIEGYDQFLCKMFDELPEYEKEFNLKIDTKRHALLHLFNYQAHENQHMKSLILNTLNTFKLDRAKKILNQIKYSLTSDAHRQNIFTD